MIEIASRIIDQLEGPFDPTQFVDHYEEALKELVREKEKGVGRKVKTEEPADTNVVDLMEALRQSIGGAVAETKAPKKSGKKPRKAASGQKEMLMPIAGKKQAKETAAKKPAARSQRKSA